MINGGEQVVQSMMTKWSGYQKETIAFIGDVFGRIYLPKSPISFLSENFKVYMYRCYIQEGCGVFNWVYEICLNQSERASKKLLYFAAGILLIGIATKIGYNFRK